MPTSWHIECLRARIRSQEFEIKRVSEKDHPYPQPDTIYKALLDVIRDRSESFEEACELSCVKTEGNLYPVDSTRSRLLDSKLETVAKDLDRVAEVFGLADRVDSARIPFEILRALSWVASMLLGEYCPAVVRLDTVYSYSITSCRRKFEEAGWIEFWHGGAAPEGATPYSTVLVLGFPSADAGSILLHTLSAHEFGHEIAHNHGNELLRIRDVAVVNVKQWRRHELEDYVTDIAVVREGVPKQDAYEEGRKVVEARLYELADCWLGEVFADLFAATLVGPAFLAALDRILLRPNEPSSTHPPGSLRRKLVRDYLTSIFPEVVQDPVWAALFGDNGEIAKTPYSERGKTKDPFEALYPIGRAICESSLPALSELLKETSSPLKAEDLTHQVSLLEGYIDNLAPPSVPLSLSGDDDASDAGNFWLVMYVAWHFRLNASRFKSFTNRCGWGEDLGKAEGALGNLVLHAVESLELRFQWAKLEHQNRQREITIGAQ